MRILRAYAGVRPLYKPPAESAAGGNRSITRAHAILDHADQGVDNFVSIVGGKLTTHRLMAEQTVDVVVDKLGIAAPCTTADEPLPDQHDGSTYWLGHRLADIEADGGGDADLLCECELVTRPMAEAYLDRHWPCTIDDVRRGTRVGMGPCQGAFCTFRVAGLIAERLDAADGGAGATVDARVDHAATADRALTAFLRERFKGSRPIAHGRQLQELLMTNGIYSGVLGLDSLEAAAVPAPVAEGVVVDAAR
jgi:glycerol-3-phosphate dehydrogenase